jgi:hypothetical protein
MNDIVANDDKFRSKHRMRVKIKLVMFWLESRCVR